MSHIVKKFMITAVLVATPTLVGANDAAKTDNGAKADKIARGKYQVTVSGCNDCHTPWKMGDKGPEPDMSRMLSGHPEGFELPPPPKAQGPWIGSVAATNTAFSGPWGISFTANLTPDPETGLGKWTLRNFKETIRTGRHMGRGRPILPPMPIPMYKHFTDADLEAVFAYLQSIPSIKNRVPEPLPPAPPVAVSTAPTAQWSSAARPAGLSCKQLAGAIATAEKPDQPAAALGHWVPLGYDFMTPSARKEYWQTLRKEMLCLV